MNNVLVTIVLSLLIGSSIGIGIGYYILQPQIDSLNEEIVILNEEKNEIEGQRIELANVNSDLNFQILDLNSDLQERLEDIKKLEEDIVVKKDEIDSLGMRISEINDQKEELERDGVRMRNQVRELEINKEENEVEIAELNEEIRENLDMIGVITNQRTSLIVERNNLREELDELKE